jgi:hypothetical protein
MKLFFSKPSFEHCVFLPTFCRKDIRKTSTSDKNEVRKETKQEGTETKAKSQAKGLHTLVRIT